MKRIAASTMGAALLALTACSGGAEDASTGTASDASQSGSAASAVRAASCSDAVGDGGSVDLTEVALLEGGEGLRVTYALTAPLNTTTGTALLSLMVSSEDGNTARQLGVKWVDGDPLVFVADFDTGNEYVDLPPIVDGATVAATFPRSALVGLGDVWNWRAGANVDGVDVDACPEPGESVLDPVQQTFPAS